MKQEENKYIGDDKFAKMLEHYQCPTPLNVIKMKFAGAVCSPNLELKPVDVIGSFWEKGKVPRLETKEEADWFFKFFMGLWDEVFNTVHENQVRLPEHKTGRKDDLVDACFARVMEIEFGFVEGFWGGRDDFELPAFVGEMIDSLSELAGVYHQLSEMVEDAEDLKPFKHHFAYTDKMVVKAISFMIENYVLPRIESLSRKMN